jgi:hypothetical protein
VFPAQDIPAVDSQNCAGEKIGVPNQKQNGFGNLLRGACTLQQCMPQQIVTLLLCQ